MAASASAHPEGTAGNLLSRSHETLCLVLLVCGPGQAYPVRAVRGAAPGKQQLDDVQVVVMNGHVQGSQAILQEGETDKENSLHSADFPLVIPVAVGSTILRSVSSLLYR